VTVEKLSHLFQTIGWVITVEGWALIRRLHLSESEPMRSIAARLGISRNNVAKAVSADGPPTYVRSLQDSGIKAAEPAGRALLRENPRMPATVLAERVGWSGSPAWFRENVVRIRPEYAPANPADRISNEPGDQKGGRLLSVLRPSESVLSASPRSFVSVLLG
jgi:hypothetical protein